MYLSIFEFHQHCADFHLVAEASTGKVTPAKADLICLIWGFIWRWPFPTDIWCRFCCSCLATPSFLFVFLTQQWKIYNSSNVRDFKRPRPTSPCSALCCSGTYSGGRQLTRFVTECLWATESSWVCLCCEFVHPQECGPRCVVNGPYLRFPNTPHTPPQSVFLKRHVTISCDIRSLAL